MTEAGRHLLDDHRSLERRISEVADAVEGADFRTIDGVWGRR